MMGKQLTRLFWTTFVIDSGLSASLQTSSLEVGHDFEDFLPIHVRQALRAIFMGQPKA